MNTGIPAPGVMAIFTVLSVTNLIVQTQMAWDTTDKRTVSVQTAPTAVPNTAAHRSIVAT